MKKLYFLISLMLISALGFAQWQQTSCPYSGQVNCFATKGDTIFAGNNSVFLSTNNGSNWTEVSTGFSGVLQVTAFTLSGSNIYTGTVDGGVYFSSNNGNSWNTAGLNNTYVSSLAIIGSNIFAGTLNMGSYFGVFLSSNNGSSWDTTAMTNTNISSLALNGSNIFAGSLGEGVFLSSNNGGLWTSVNNGITNNQIYALAINGSNIFAGSIGGGVFLSSNNGGLWTAVNNGLTNNQIYALAINGSNIFAGTNGGGVFLSTNNGSSWTDINNGLPTGTWVTALAISDSNIFAGTYNNGIWRLPLSQLGIKETNNNESNIKTFPNPTNDNLTIVTPEKAAIEISNIEGQIIKTITTADKQTTIDVADLSSGVYIIKAKTERGVAVKKFIKE